MLVRLLLLLLLLLFVVYVLPSYIGILLGVPQTFCLVPKIKEKTRARWSLLEI